MNKRSKEEIYRDANKIITNYLRLDENELQPSTHIVDEAGADSLALVELGFQLTEKFGVSITDTSDEMMVFQNLVNYIFENMSKTQKVNYVIEFKLS